MKTPQISEADRRRAAIHLAARLRLPLAGILARLSAPEVRVWLKVLKV